MVALLKGDGTAIMTIFIGAIIALAMIGSIADTISPQTEIRTAFNLTFTSGTGINGDNVTILEGIGREVDDSVTIITTNETDSEMITTGNYTVYNEVVNRVNVIRVGVLNGEFNSTSTNITLGYKPYGYINESSGRSVVLLITIFASLAIVVFSIVLLIKRGSLGTLIKG